MSLAQLWDSAILGIIEGLTEFIPVSSTGHLILGEAVLRRAQSDVSGVFDVFIQIGAILAVIWVKRYRIFKLAKGFFVSETERLMAIKIIIAFIPCAIAGVFFHTFIKETLFTTYVVAVSLVLGGIVLLIVERMAPAPSADTIDSISLKTAFGIGLCQVIALIPGISRAGASIVGGQFLSVDRKAATEFSFFLGIPTILGAATFDLYKNRALIDISDLPIFAMGTITAFFSGILVVNGLIAFVGKYGFKPFGYYRIIIGIVILFLIQQRLL